ncbi:MAG: hypothetical protein ACI9S8_002335 [Chlamydiales bacterium]|jgi:hypothetical protein
MAARLIEKVNLSSKGLLRKARNILKKVKEPPRGRQGLEKRSVFQAASCPLLLFLN